MLAEPGDDNTTHTVVKRDGSMRSTNHSLLRQIPESWENDPEIRGSRERLQRMDANVMVDPDHPFTADRRAHIADRVAVSTQWPESGGVLGRTLWSASYRPRNRALAIRFWVGTRGSRREAGPVTRAALPARPGCMTHSFQSRQCIPIVSTDRR